MSVTVHRGQLTDATHVFHEHTSKCQYRAKGEAKSAARRAAAANGGRLMEVYRCGICGYYHFGHPKRK